MRNNKITALRPTLDLPQEDMTEMEAFQNETLRPIMKFQAAMTLSLIDNSAHFNKLKAKVDVDDTKAMTELVTKYITSNVVFRSKLLGMVLGMMTVDELAYYHPNHVEVGKRIVAMQIERYVDRLQSINEKAEA